MKNVLFCIKTNLNINKFILKMLYQVLLIFVIARCGVAVLAFLSVPSGGCMSGVESSNYFFLTFISQLIFTYLWQKFYQVSLVSWNVGRNKAFSRSGNYSCTNYWRWWVFLLLFFLLSSTVNNIARVFLQWPMPMSKLERYFAICLSHFVEQLVMEIYLWKWATQPELPAQ